MKARGFGDRWIKLPLIGAKSQILVNSKRRLKWGDPFSPLLFVLAVDSLTTTPALAK